MVERIIPQGVGRDEKALVLANTLLFEKYFDIASLDAKTDAQKEAWDLDKPKLGSDMQAGEALEEMLVDMGGGKVLVRTRGMKVYEFSNHLGNVLVTISDKVLYDVTSSVYIAQVATAQDYYPFGSVMPGRKYEGGSGYRYGFNGQDKDSDINSGAYDFGARIFDARLGRWWSVDPLAGKYPSITPYNFCFDSPIKFVDPDGRDPRDMIIIFTGHQLFSANQPTTQAFYNTLLKYSTSNHIKMVSTSGYIHRTFYDQTDGLKKEVLAHLNAHADARVIIVGYSYGADLAMEFTNELNASGKKVDFLYTIDGTRMNSDDRISNIGSVGKNVNFFSSNKPEGAFANYLDLHGGVNTADNGEVLNNDLTSGCEYNGKKIDHYNIDDFSYPLVLDDLLKSSESTPVSSTAREDLEVKIKNIEK